MKKTFIVSGFMRHGTSMMMQALEAGGLDAAYDESRNQMNEQFGDDYYKPNEGGFYELKPKDYKAIDFPRAYEGRLIKCLFGGMAQLQPGNYRIIFMLRDFEEARQSYEAFFHQKAPFQKEEVFLAHRDRALGILRQRRDCRVFALQYREVLEHPLFWFRYLKWFGGFPINPKKAAAVVDEKRCRFRREELEEGI